MKKMKKIVAFLLVAAMVLSLAACGKKNDGGDTNTTGTPAPTQGAGQQDDTLKGEYKITVWCPDLAVDLTKTQIENFNKENTYGIKIVADVQPVGEGEAATNMLQDVEAGADIFFFAQDQLARLVQGGALAQLGKGATTTVKTNNVASTVAAATVGETVYAYPLTNDNGYYVYYDKSVLSADDVKDLATMVKKCEEAKKYFAFEVEGSAWYTASFFFATGCDTVFQTNDEGKFTGYTDTFNSANGLVSAKGMQILTNSSMYLNSSQASEFANGAAVVVSGPWDVKTAQELLGANYAAAELPSFTVDGKSYHLGSFSGCKLLGAKPQKDAVRSAAINQLALYLTGEKAQTERFTALGWGPSNLTAAATEAVKADAALSALGAQGAYAKPQGQIDGAWWDIGKALGTEIKEAKDEAGLKAALSNYVAKLDAVYAMSSDEKEAFTVIGGFGGTSWSTDIAMTKDGDVWTSTPIEFAAGDEFKVRQGKSWDVAYGAEAGVTSNASNFKVETAGTFKVVLDTKAGTITLVP